ncbi:isopeptide-forming domain-containing fimbrial protein [Companilactobacillus futsaii]|uniref:Isopeptide-forming domain-containing fimbrial protein n=2 Tax=Companilactobacillus futsaii TaxID=938155 RepID=A0A5B7T4K8_9LACO|nr:isopeptide-forming domain-containing fimbrial protein [Companilactobacillus futsaii]KRK93072.1 cell surface protein precursor [Companilactobacillus futsaii JCM 17355]QCX25285.1 isopeptide-forming domain-containing fimbrial protein [Companilactobacillus futsaii]
MKGYQSIPKVLLLVFTALLMVLTFNTTKAKAAAATISKSAVTDAEKVMRKYDGIDSWTFKGDLATNEVGKIPIGGNISLGYAFGAARDVNGNVKAGDKTISHQSTVLFPKISNSKINIFLDDNGKYYGILHQGEDSYIGGSPENASNTSIDFALLESSQSASNFYADMNLLANASQIDSANGGIYKLFYTATDKNGKKILKMVGHFYKKGVFFEIVLRPSPSGSPVLQRELYVYNPGSKNVTFQPFYGEDTGLNPNNGDNSSVDNVPMFAIGGGLGLYIESGLKNSESKLFITNNIDGGFKDFMGRVLAYPDNWSIKGKDNNKVEISSPTLPVVTNDNHSSSLDGDTNAKADQNLLIGKSNSGQEYKIVNGNGKQDTSYILRWPYTTLAPGGVAKFVSNIGATVKPYAIPTVKKTYKNLTSKDGTNNVGDKLHFTLSVRNDGYGSNWIISKIRDDLPTGLTIDPNSALASGNGIDYNPNVGVTDGATATYEFDATINNKAPVYATNGIITNTVKFTGYNKGFSDTRTYEDSVDIPIETPDYAYDFTHQVRNVTADPGSDFSDSVDATTGDTLEIKSIFTVSVGTAKDAIYKNKALDDDGDGLNIEKDKLSLISGSVYMNGVPVQDAIQSGLHTHYTPAGQPNTFVYRIKVNSSTEETIQNSSTMENVKDINSKVLSIDPSDSIYIHVHPPVPTTSFIEVPELIDFGSINSTGTEKMLTNKQTKGSLIVSHSAETPYQVLVSYDNNSEQALAKGDEKLIQDDGLSLLLDNNYDGEPDDWEPISSTGIPINNQEFVGSDEPLDLTKYVGLDKWKLRVPSTATSGQYTGQVTWTIADTPIE